jgi:hypothetical protein
MGIIMTRFGRGNCPGASPALTQLKLALDFNEICRYPPSPPPGQPGEVLPPRPVSASSGQPRDGAGIQPLVAPASGPSTGARTAVRCRPRR